MVKGFTFKKTTKEAPRNISGEFGFKPIEGFEELYEMDKFGTVISLKIYQARKPNYILTTKVDGDSGELFVRLYKDREWVKCYIEDLIYVNFQK